MKPSKFEISISIESYDENTTENDRNCYVAENPIVSELPKISSQILIAQIEDLNKDCVKISRPYPYTFREISLKERYGLVDLLFKMNRLILKCS